MQRDYSLSQAPAINSLRLLLAGSSHKVPQHLQRWISTQHGQFGDGRGLDRANLQELLQTVPAGKEEQRRKRLAFVHYVGSIIEKSPPLVSLACSQTTFRIAIVLTEVLTLKKK